VEGPPFRVSHRGDHAVDIWIRTNTFSRDPPVGTPGRTPLSGPVYALRQEHLWDIPFGYPVSVSRPPGNPPVCGVDIPWPGSLLEISELDGPP
jgi:hypothetical protein